MTDLDKLVGDAKMYGGNYRWLAIYEIQKRTRKALERAYEGMVKERDDQIHRKRETRRILQARIDYLKQALEAIGASDPLFDANPEAFGLHAYRRCQSIARNALLQVQKLTATPTATQDVRPDPIESDGEGWGHNEVRHW